MAQDKNKNGSKNDFSAEAKFLKEALVAMGILSAMLSLSLAGILAYYAEELDAKGYTAWEIFKSKLWRVASLAPFALLFAYILAIYIPKNISIKNYFTVHQSTSNPTTETEYRENVENIKSKIENAEMEISSAKSSKSIAIDDNKRLVREYNRAKTVEEQSELEEQNKRVEKDFKEANENISKYTAELPKLKEKLQIAREDLEAFREGRPTSFDKPVVTSDRTLETSETTNENKSKFMFYALVFLLVSIPLSYPMIYFTRSEHKSLSRIQFALKWLNEVVISRMEYIGLYPIMLLSKYVHKDSDETIRPSNAKDVMQLGIEKNAYLTDRNLNYHTQIIGGSGSGKTNLLKVAIEDRVAKGHSVIFFDFKADVELMDWIAGLVEYYNRKEDLVMLSMSDPKMSFAYNPIKHGTETEISSQLMNSFVWSEPYYKNKAEGALLIILKAFCYQRDIGGREFHLGELYRFLNDASFRMDIVSAISLLNYPEMYRGDLKRICEELTTSKKDDYQILITQIGKILNSSAGDIVANKIGNDEEFEFKDSMESGKIAYLFMNSLKLKETASVMGKLMLQDLMKTVGNIYDDRNAIKRPTTLIIDEFASFATPDFGEFIEKARGAGISVIVAYQSRKSLDYIGENLALKINENTANKIAFQIQDSEDVEWFCSLLGTKTTKKETYQAEEGIFWDNKTGQKSVREVEEYVVHPNQIKKLKLGQAFLYCSKIDPHHCIMNIKMANDFFGKYERQSLVSQNLRKVDLIKTDQPKEKGNEVNNYF